MGEANDTTPTSAVPLAKGLIKHKAEHRKLILSGTDVGTYDFLNPTVKPDTATGSLTFDEMEKLYWTSPLIHKGINIRANRVIGDGFELEPSDHPDVPPAIAEQAKAECEKFLKNINYITFFKNSIINAYVAGNEWTELIYNRMEEKKLITVAHGDFRSIDFRRDLLGNKILLDDEGQPTGYWQYISDLSQLYRTISTVFGSVDTLENLKAAKDRLEETQHMMLYDQHGNEIGVVLGAYKPQYMFLNRDEIVHLSFNNLNDNFYGTTMILPAYDAVYQLTQIQLALGETINNMGYPKPVLKFGNDKVPPTEQMADEAEALVQDPVRKESFAIPYYMDLAYLSMPAGAAGSSVSDYPTWYVTAIAIGLRIPRELLVGDGESNRSTSIQASTDFEKDVEADRKILEEYIYQIFHYYLETHGFMTNTPHKRNPYIPTIRWPKLIAEDEKMREDMVLQKFNAGLITVNEARDLLGMEEIEDHIKGESYANESKTPIADGVSSVSPESPFSEALLAKHTLQKKSELNPKLNKQYGTKGIDYHQIAIKSVGKKIKSVSKAKAKKIRDILVNSEAKGKSSSAIIKNVKKVGGYTDAHARMVVSTEQVNMTEQAKLESAKKAGMKYKKWEAVLDKDTSPLCKALHGKTIPIDAEFEVSYEENGEKKTWKGPAPAAHPSCRSQLIFKERGDKS